MTRKSTSGCPGGDDAALSSATVYEAHDVSLSHKAFAFVDGSSRGNAAAVAAATTTTATATAPPPIAFDEVPFSAGGVGHVIWPAGVALALWAWGAEGQRCLNGRDVLELGAGMGLPSFVAATLLQVSA